MPAISFEAEHITNSLEVSFALALLNVIESTKKDPAQLRHIVYDLARVQLEQKSGGPNLIHERRQDLAADGRPRGCNCAC
jgi:hypothetical protein